MKCLGLKGIFIASLLLGMWPTVAIAGSGRANVPADPIFELNQGWEYRWDDLSSGTDDTGSFDSPAKAGDEWKHYDPRHAPHRGRHHFLVLRKTLSEAEIPQGVVFMPQYSCFRAFEV